MLRLYVATLIALLVSGLAAPVAAQQNSSVTQADIQRLQDNAFQAGTDVSQLRRSNAARADELQAELDELREDVIYLKVKLRRERSLVRSEYADVRDRIEDLRTRARGDTADASTPPASTQTGSQTGTNATSTTSGGSAEDSGRGPKLMSGSPIT